MFTHPSKSLILSIAILCFVQKIYAQAFPQLYFETINTSSGLSDNIITCIYEDKKGFLWIGTSNGLNRYDGNNFQTFFNENGNKNSLSGNVIVDIFEDAAGIFWIATRDGGLTRYDPSQTKDKQFIQFRNDPKVPGSIVSNRMTAIADLDADFMLISAENMSVGFVNKNTFEITYNSQADTTFTLIDPRSGKDKPGRPGWVHHFGEYNNWIYTSKMGRKGMTIINKNTKKELLLNYSKIISSVIKFEVDGDTIWHGSWADGLFMLSNTLTHKNKNIVEQKRVVDINDEIICVTSLSKNYLLAGAKTSGLYLVDKNSFDHVKIAFDRGNKFSLASNRVNCIFKDRNGIIWVGTTAGISKYNPVQWQFNAYLLNDNFEKDIIHFSTFSYNDSTIGVGTTDGIYKFKKASNAFSIIEFNYSGLKLNPTSVVNLNDDKYYLNTESGTFWYDPITNAIDMLSPEKNYNLGSNTLTSADYFRKGSYQVYNTIFDTVDEHPLQLFSTIGWGVGLYDEKEKVYYDVCTSKDTQSISNNFVRVIYKDSKNNIWVGTSEGLNKWKKSIPIENKFLRYINSVNDSTTISHNTITGLYEDNENNLWISTANGINRFDGKRFYYYTPSVSVNTSMNGLYADNNNNLWTVVRGGFQVFNLETKTFRFISLLNNTWWLKNPATIYQHPNGEWYYGAGNFLINFNPDKYYFENDFPEVYLTDFILQDDPIFQTSKFNDLSFKHDENFITILFSSLQLSQPGSVKYKYRLEGLNEEWIEIGNTGKITFTSLPPGYYKLLLKVTNPQGEWSNTDQLIEFVILKPYWQQWWFFLLCALLTIGMAYAIIRYREKQILNLQIMRNKIANDLHDDVGSALSTINVYSEVAKMKSIDENVELKNILDKISNTSIEMQENMNHIVWSLQPRNDNFQQMMLRMKEYAFENLQAKNINPEFIIDENLHDIKLSPDQRKELFLIFKEVIHNIFKYANCTEVKINFHKIKNELVMQISDNGQGFDQDKQSTGNGLFTMHERTKQLKGNLKINSVVNKGTTTTLIFAV